jgi:outer membrane protein TolC
MFNSNAIFIRSVFVVIIALVSNAIQAQNLFTLDDALKTALQNNYAIQVAKSEAEISKVNNYAGNAGMMPRVLGSVLQDNQIANTDQRYQKSFNRPEAITNGAEINQLTASAELGWTIFDGLKMFATKNKLKELQDIGEIRMRFQIEFIFTRVIRAYFDVVLGQQLLTQNKESVKLSEERLTLAKDRFAAGKAAKNEVLNAQVDLNTDRSALKRQEIAVKNSKASLNQIIARDVTVEFEVPEIIDVNADLKFDDLRSNATTQNSSILMAKMNARVTAFGIKEIEAERMPNIQLYSGYNYANQNSQSGILQYSSSLGYHFGGGVTLNLFNGFSVSKRLQVAQINSRESDLVLKDTLSRIELSVKQSYNTYQMDLDLIKFEKENVEVAMQNFELANDQYKIGVITAIELRQAQQNLLLSNSRYLSVRYEAKLAETDLMRISGGLFKLK